MTLKNKKITFLGAGNMAEGLIRGILYSKLVPPENITASDVVAERLDKLKKELNINVTQSNVEAVKDSEILFLAVKPQNLKDLLSEIESVLSNNLLIISIAAGMRIEKIEKMAGKKLRIIRVMPNLPALVQAGVSTLLKLSSTQQADLETAKILLSSVGETVLVERENDLDAVTALSGSGPGYLFYFAEALEKAGVASGLPESVVQKLVSTTLFGSSKLLLQSSETAEQLRKKVTSKGGTTEAALAVLQEKKFIATIEEAISAAVKRSGELSQ